MRAKKLVIGLCCGLGAVAIGLGAWNFKTISNSFRKWTSTPEEYFYYIEERSAKEAISVIGSTYETMRTSLTTEESRSYEGAFTVEFGEELQALWAKEEAFRDAELSELGVKYAGVRGAETGTTQCTMSLVLNGSEVIDGTYWQNTAKGDTYLQIPKLSKDILKISTEVPEDAVVVSSEKVMEYLEELYAILPEQARLEGMLERYFYAALAEISEVEEETALLSTEEVSMRCTRLTAVLDGEELSKVLEAMVEEMLRDEELEKLISDFVSVQQIQEFDENDELYDEIYDALKELRHSARKLRDYEEETEIIVWVDKKGNVVGRSLFFGRKNGFSYAFPYEKDKIGFEAELVIDGAEYSVEGTGTLNQTELTVEYDIKAEGLSLFEGQLTADVKSLMNGEGTVTITVDPTGKAEEALAELDEAWEEDYDCSPNLKELYVQLVFGVTKDVSTAEYSFYTGEALLFRLYSEHSEKAGGEVDFPKDESVRELQSEAALLEWLSGTKIEELLDGFQQAGLPAEWFEEIEIDRDEMKYMAALEYVFSEEYQKAKDIFFALGQYDDAEDYLYFCEGMLLYEKGDLEAAVALFDEIKDAPWVMIEGMNECKFALAEQYLANEDYETAKRLFYEVYLNHYYYSDLSSEAYDMYCYTAAVLHSAAGDYEAAVDALEEMESDYEPALKLWEDCKAHITEENAYLQRPLHQLYATDYAYYTEFVTLPDKYIGIPMRKVDESDYEAYIAWEAQVALNEGRELSEEDISRLREQCEEETYTFAVMDYLLEYGDVSVVDEFTVLEKAKIDVYRYRMELESYGIDWDAFLESGEITEDEILSFYEEERRNREKVFVMAYAIAQKEGLTVTEEDYNYFVTDMSEDLGVTEADFLQANPKKVLDEAFLIEKTLLFLIENADIQ